MFDNISKESLERLGIYELRNVARQVGVYSPTLYKKEILIEKVMSIINGEEEPYKKKTNQGRPAKQISGLDEILNIFVPSVSVKSFYQRLSNKEQIFSSKLFQDIKVLPDKIEPFSGFVKMLDNYAVVFKNGYFEGNNNSYYITPQLLKQNSIKDGDYIKGLFYNNGPDKAKLVHTIELINNTNFNGLEINRLDYEKMEAVYPNIQLCVGNDEKSLIDFKLIDKICPIGKGSRVIVDYDEEFDIEEYIVELVGSLEKTEKNVTLIAVDERPEDLFYIKNECLNLKVIDTVQNYAIEDFAEYALMIIKHLERLVEKGENQILIIKNMNKLKNLLSKYYVLMNKNTDEANIMASETIKEIFLLAKNTLSERNLTIFAFNCLDDELLKLSNCYIYINQNGYQNTDVHLDCIKSKTIKANLLLSKQGYEKLSSFKSNLSEENIVQKLNDLV